MALVFFLLAALFVLMGVFDAVDGSVHTKVGSVLRSQSPELFWKLVRRSFGFGAVLIMVSGFCALGARALTAKS